MAIRPKAVLIRLFVHPGRAPISAWPITRSLFRRRDSFQPHPSSYKTRRRFLKLTSATAKKISALYLPNLSAKFRSWSATEMLKIWAMIDDWLKRCARSWFQRFCLILSGLRTSEGQPSEQGLYEDEECCYDYLVPA